jgi:hypothetical protein
MDQTLQQIRGTGVANTILSWVVLNTNIHTLIWLNPDLLQTIMFSHL